jgi:hypothetical protein
VGQRSRRKLSVHVRGASELSGANGSAATAAANGAGTETCATKEAPKEAPKEPEAAAAAAAKPAAENGPLAKAAAATKPAPATAATPESRPVFTSPAALARMARVAADATGQRDGGQHGAPPPEAAPQQGAPTALKTASLGNWDGPPGSAAASGPVVKNEPPAQQAPAGGGSSAGQDGQASQSPGVRAGSLGSWGAAQQGAPEQQLVQGAPEQQPASASPDGNAAGKAVTAAAAARMAGIAANTVAQRGEAQGDEEDAPETGLRPPSLGNWAGVPKRTLAAASAPAAAGQLRDRRVSLDRRTSLDRRISLDTVPEQGAEAADIVCTEVLMAFVAFSVVSCDDGHRGCCLMCCSQAK